MTWHVNRAHQGSLQGACSLSTFPSWLSRWEWNLTWKKKMDKTSNLLGSHPWRGLPECFSADITAQRPGKPISPSLYHSPLPASCPDDVTLHMVFSSIKPEKRFSQRRGERREKEEGWNGAQVGHRKQKACSSPCVHCEWRGGGEGVRGEWLHCVRLMRRDQGAETMHRTAMCCTDAHWTGRHANTYTQRKHTSNQWYCNTGGGRTKLRLTC